MVDGKGDRAGDETVTLDPARPRAAHAPADPATTRAGTRLGRYELRALLGHGGVGEVYRARDLVLERDVALKLLQDDTGSPTQRTRLMREAKAMAKLSHPNLVTVFDAGVVDGQYFIAMELVDGHTLRSWHGTCAPSPDQIIDTFVAAARGLQAAHDAGIVHRDFKPSNVLIGPNHTVQVTDFGIAMLPEAEPDEPGAAQSRPRASYLTRTGGAPGTPRYMSPEQHLGAPVDARADQFSFAVALAEALNGEPPFPGTTYREIAEHVLNRSPILRNRDTPIGTVLLRALARDPADRFASMVELMEALAAARRPRRSRGQVALGVGLGAALALALVIAVVATVKARSGAGAVNQIDAGRVAVATAAAAAAPAVRPADAGVLDARPRLTRASEPPDAGRRKTRAPSRRTSRRSRRSSRIPKGWRVARWQGKPWICRKFDDSKACHRCCKSPAKQMPYPDCGCYYNHAALRRKDYLSKLPPGWRVTDRRCASKTYRYSDRPSETVCVPCCRNPPDEKVLAYPDCRCAYDHAAWERRNMVPQP